MFDTNIFNLKKSHQSSYHNQNGYLKVLPICMYFACKNHYKKNAVLKVL